MVEWLIGGSLLAAAAGSVALWARGTSLKTIETEGEADGEGFSLARYEPMKRLLSPDDLAFLKQRPGIPAEVVKKLKADRYRVFRKYLNELAADFERLHAQARQLVTQAPEEYAELVGILMQQQVRFRVALAGVQVRLALHQAGIGSVDVGTIFAPIQALHVAVQNAMGEAPAA
jgi:hypothetical protein